MAAMSAALCLVAGFAFLPSADASGNGSRAAGTGPEQPLSILITNDDGWRGPGGSSTPLIVALRDALIAHGHRATVVAPATDQSAMGTSLSGLTGPIALANPEPGVWTVDGPPALAQWVGTDVVLRDDPPDLVVSGINAGGNYTRFANSGTLGAALTAVQNDVPGIAVSLAASKARYPVLKDDAAEYVAELVDALTSEAQRRRGPLLPDGIALNINYPDTTSLKGSELTVADPNWSSYIDFANTAGQDGEPGVYKASFGETGDAPELRDSDWSALLDGKVSITPVAPLGTVAPATFGELEFLERVDP